MNGTSLKSEFVMQAEWDKCALQELDITATDLSPECLVDMLTRIPSLKFLSAGQINGFNDSVLKQWMESGTTRWAEIKRFNLLNSNFFTEIL